MGKNYKRLKTYFNRSKAWDKFMKNIILEDALNTLFVEMYELKMKADDGDEIAKKAMDSTIAVYKKNGVAEEYFKQMRA